MSEWRLHREQVIFRQKYVDYARRIAELQLRKDTGVSSVKLDLKPPLSSSFAQQEVLREKKQFPDIKFPGEHS